ncbi:hypothetical protein QR680_009887 [Steinernema hermaphroditum]|uniref:Trimethylguanosine synthase n=1 Tax=Steinernema hermaphroditum TaxID=289476 RepID=A0AA39IN92_9BILA|nr:hypothetical protein QR680_009887 [Steinernema hermaphroditum]
MYRFDWRRIADLEITHSGDDVRPVLFTRVFTCDRDLLKLAADSEAEKLLEDAHSASRRSLTDTELCEKDLQCLEALTIDGEHALEPQEVAEAGNNNTLIVPSDFPSEFISTKRPLYMKPCYGEIRLAAAENFLSYWARIGEYLISQSWLNDYGDQMDQEQREQLVNRVAMLRPSKILKSEENGYSGVFREAGEDPSAHGDWNKLFSRFCALVERQCRESHERVLSKSAIAVKCYHFFRKIAQWGYLPGFRVDGNLFENVKYCFYYASEDESQPTESESISPEENVASPLSLEDEQASRDLMKVVTKIFDKNMMFDYSTDLKNDEHLLAANALLLCKQRVFTKYWLQRYRIFSKFDEGVMIDKESWCSATPERISAHIADRLIQAPGKIVLDAFTGVGGNAIQFALKGAHVIAVDTDRTHLKCAQHNARIYGVEKSITFVLGDFFEVAKILAKNKFVDAVFLAPSWGGPSYKTKRSFQLEAMEPCGFKVFNAAKEISPNIAFFLPKNITLKQVLELAGKSGRCEMEQNTLNNKIKAVTAYYGNLCESSA